MSRSPCCDAQLVLVSPPTGYECRECYTRHDLCGAALRSGGECRRLAADCPYHDGDD